MGPDRGEGLGFLASRPTARRQTMHGKFYCSRILISGTALSGRCFVHSDSFHKQNVQRLAGLLCK
jgi:hypothetical protein